MNYGNVFWTKWKLFYSIMRNEVLWWEKSSARALYIIALDYGKEWIPFWKGCSSMVKEVLWKSCIGRRKWFYGRGSSMVRRKCDYEKEVVLWKRKFYNNKKKIVISEGCSLMEKEVLWWEESCITGCSFIKKEVLWWEESCIMRRMFFYGKGNPMRRRKLDY